MLINEIKILFSVFCRSARFIRGWYWKVLIILMGGRVGKSFRVGARLNFKSPPHQGILIGDNVSIGPDVVIDVPEPGILKLGNRVKLNLAIVIAARDFVSLGDDVIVGEYTSVRDSDHGTHLFAGSMQSQVMEGAPINIENDVWIGRGVAILKGVTIKAGAVVGSNAVVTKSISENEISAGVPAKKISSRL